MPPFAPNGFAPGGRALVNGSRLNGSPNGSRGPSNATSVSLALDNMIRSQLKVSDPRNPKEIAQALLSYYKDLPQAAAITEEAQGLPFLQATQPLALPPPRPTSSDAEFRIADGDVEKALTDLATNPLTNDIVPEMQGWADSIRSAVVQGYTAARQGLDPTQRDLVFAMRRQLGEYGRMARFVGSLSPGMTQNYRRLGQALDETSAVLLVMLGESLARVGFASGYYLLQVPLAELQQRRDAVIFALRNFTGGAQQAYGPDDWPRGIDAYRRLYNWLEQQGQGDLRSLLIENEIAQSMDALISRAQNGTAEGLRALGVTAQLDIERFRRMVIVARGAMPRVGGFPDRSPPLEAFLQALDLFAETFRPAGGLRLLRIARPPILYYGIYNPNLLEDDQDLVELIMVRGNLATIFDGLFPSAGMRSIEPQVLLDMLLLELDRGTDLLALDANPQERGPTIRRATAYWRIVEVILNLVQQPGFYINPMGHSDDLQDPFETIRIPAPDPITGAITFTIEVTDDRIGRFPAAGRPTVVFISPRRTRGNVQTLPAGNYRINAASFNQPPVGPTTYEITFTSSTVQLPNPGPPAWGGEVTLTYLGQPAVGPIAEFAAADPDFADVLGEISQTYSTGTRGIAELRRALNRYNQLANRLLPARLDPRELIAVMEELRVQHSLEDRWRNLVRTVAPEAGNQERVFRLLELVVEQAISNTDPTARGRAPLEPPLPPQFEETLAEIARPRMLRAIP